MVSGILYSSILSFFLLLVTMLRLSVVLLACLLSSSVQSNTIQQLEAELKKNRYSQAAKIGLAMLRQQPKDIQAQFLTAVAFQQNRQPEIAQRYYLQIINSNPELPEPRNNLAMIYMDKGQYDEAINLLITSLKTHPAYATVWQNLNLLYQGLASEAYRKALSKENNSRSVMDKIQLSALSTLYGSTTQTPEPSKPAPKKAKPLQLAKVPAPVAETKTIKAIVPAENTQDNLIKPLQDWASAWSQKKFDNYINAYAKDYKGNKASHQAWVNYRRTRIMKAGGINVQLTRFKIKSHSQSQAIIDFHQSFKSPTYRDNVVKRIYLTKINNHWKITKETTIAAL
ncbi:MAG: tetratricopeptide repeat protein [Gammaproteobacteria bacterium]|nr:tetratricopeptide repeat protein [Gammaproteobacteria bacterium]